MRTLTKHILTALALIICSFFHLQAAVKVNPDNFFIRPKSTAQTVLDILANDFYAEDGTLADMSITFPGLSLAGSGNYWNSPQGGRVYYDSVTKQVKYRPANNFVGLDQFIYQLESSATGSKSQATVFVYVNDKPESVMDDVTCFVEPDALQWGIQEITRSKTKGTNFVNTGSNILAGDIDGDGKSEILVYNADTTTVVVAHRGGTNKILVFEYDDVTNEFNLDYEIPLPGLQYVYVYGNFAMGSVDDDGTSSLFVAYTGGTNTLAVDPPLLVKYKYTPGVGNAPGNFVKGTFAESWRKEYTTDNRFRNPSPLIVDLMGDGNKQVVVLNKVFDAKTGALLVDGGMASTPITPWNGFSFGRMGHDGYNSYISGYNQQTAFVAADLDGDGIKELVGGNCVYKVNISEYEESNNPTSVNTIELWKKTKSNGRPGIADGGTALVDLDLDGNLDVVVTSKSGRYLYAYNPITEELLHTNDVVIKSSGGGPSQPFVGDLDGDGYPEIALTASLTLQAFKLEDDPGNPGTKILRQMWELPTSDGSAATTLSIFDFAQSGTSQLIYRDETTLRIIDGREYDENGVSIDNDDRIFAKFDSVFSPTINEYPIVADVTGDGYAKILAVGGTIRTTNNFCGELRMYGPVNGHWAPSMSVWNQIAFNPLNVNSDLSIPSNPLSPADVFVDYDGSESRPFNNFLQQSTALNIAGTMIQQGSDLAFASNVPKKLEYVGSGDDIRITCTVENLGDAGFMTPFSVRLYAYDSDASDYVFIGSSSVLNSPSGMEFGAKASLAVDFTIVNGKTLLPSNQDGWALTVNLTSKPGVSPVVYENSSKECHDGINNQTKSLNFLDGMRVVCEGGSDVITANPVNTYNIRWYDANGVSLLPAGSYSDTYTLPSKDSDDVTYLLVQAYNKTTGALINAVKDTVFVYRAPSKLIWNGSVNRNWHDSRNWSNPNSNKYPEANIPRSCTDVQLPALPSSGSASYPDLSSVSGSDYSVYSSAFCGNIVFNFGGELKRPDLLNYDQAEIDLTILAHQWHLFAPPLKNFYTGDLYQNDPVPVNDPIKSYIRMWEKEYSMGNYDQASWTRMLYEPDTEMALGQGLKLWVSDEDPAFENDNRDFTLNFPKPDTKYHVYFKGTDRVNPYITTRDNLDRSQSGRFIFDGQGGNGSDISLNLQASASGRMVLVANPFMAHLDFDKFYEKNKTLIKPEYRILNPNNNDYLYYRKDQPAASTLDNMIAPMQAFLVESTTAFTSLIVNATMSDIHVGKTLKSGTREVSCYTLPIDVRQDGYSGRAFVQFSELYSNSYSGFEDVSCLFDTISSEMLPVSIYSRSEDNKSLSLNCLNVSQLQGGMLPLGIRTPSNKPLTINVGNLSLIPRDCNVLLCDLQDGREYNLKTNSSITFSGIDVDKNGFLDNRFFIKFSNNSSSIGDMEMGSTANTLYISSRKGEMHIESVNLIDRIEVYNLQGQLLHTSLPSSRLLSLSLPDSDLYIVRVEASSEIISRKVVDKK